MGVVSEAEAETVRRTDSPDSDGDLTATPPADQLLYQYTHEDTALGYVLPQMTNRG